MYRASPGSSSVESVHLLGTVHEGRPSGLQRSCQRPEGLGVLDVTGVLYPLDDLSHGEEVDFILAPVVLKDLVHPVEEGVQELGVVLEPGSVEVEAERCSVVVEMPVEVVGEEVV